MNLHPKHPLVRLAYWFRPGYNVPERVSLCTLFWRVIGHAVVVPPVLALLYVIIIPASYIVFETYVVAPSYKLLYAAAERARERRRAKAAHHRDNPPVEMGPSSWHVFRHWLWAKKQRVCPIITIHDDGEF